MLRALVLSLGIACFAPGFALAQDRSETLADIRQELSVIFVEIQRLRTELSTTVAPNNPVVGGNSLDRIDAIEAELRRLSRMTEQLQIRVERVVSDGSNRIGDLEFRLCELEEACDIATLGDTPSLGGDTGGAMPIIPAPSTDPAGPQLAVSEQADFDRAREAFDAQNWSEAASLFQAFTDTYSGGPLSGEAHFLRGEAEAQQSQWSRAARAYLDSFSGSPDNPRAPEALMKLGTSLAQLERPDEACLALAEVGTRYPGSPAVLEAQSAMMNIGCN